MHSSRMCKALSLPYGGGSLLGGLCLSGGGVSVWGGQSLSRGSLSRGSLSRGSLSGKPPPPVDRQVPVKILPCPKLCLRAVIYET